jgi:protoheme IX farnesyltransferase
LASTVTTRTIARGLGETLAAYLRLTKPRIVLLLVVTTIPAMMLAEGGMPSAWLMLATVLGGSVVAGGANAMNMYFDRDIDEMMYRTQGRPVPAGQLEPEKAALFGMAMGGAGFTFMYLAVNPLSAFLTIFAFAFYVIVYTLILKRTTPLNIVIGGAAGAMPPLIGWAAVTDEIGVAGALMFGIVTLWTPPHFWALSINYSSDYERAGVPMLPVVAGKDSTKRWILLHALAMVACTLALPFASDAGVLYAGIAAALGAAFLYFSVRVWQSPTPKRSMALFRYSIAYLGLLFGAIAVDTFAGI